MLAQSLAYDLKTSGKRRLTELPCAALAGRGSMVPIAFELPGVEFIDENGGGPGVRLRKRTHKTIRKTEFPFD